MTATIIAQYDHPHRELIRLRGNMQILPDKNILVGWNKSGYLSEFTPDGRLVLEASFVSQEFSTYRAYKFNFIGKPAELPVLRVFAYGVNPAKSTTVCYVSWNGATEVSHWRFYGQAKSDSANFPMLGTIFKQVFETVFMVDGYVNWVMAEVLDATEQSLGCSEWEKRAVHH